MAGGEGVAIKLCVEPSPFSRWALAAKEPFEDGRDCAGGYCTDQHSPSKISPGGVSPDDGHCPAKQPKYAVATVRDGERQQA